MDQLIDHTATLLLEDDRRAIRRVQALPDSFFADLAEARATSRSKAPEAVRVASIPTALVESWQRAGFDVFVEPASAIVARLRAENLHAFLATERSV